MGEIAVTIEMPADVEAAFRARHSVRFPILRQIGPDAFLRQVEGVEVVVPAPGDRIDAELIARLPASVRMLASYSVGLDHIDLPAAAARGMTVTNTPDVLTDATADVAMLLILGAMRGAGDGERIMRSGAWDGWTPKMVFGRDLAGKTLGIWGFGRIGRATALRAAPFGLKVIYHGRRRREQDTALSAAFEPDLGRFLARSDIVSLHIASTPETRGALGRAEIAALKPGAVVVNTGRGDLIDEDALIEAVTAGRIGGVGLDVYIGEPAIDPRWREAPHTFLLPHIGSSTHETRAAMGAKVLASIDAFLAGETPLDRVI